MPSKECRRTRWTEQGDVAPWPMTFGLDFIYLRHPLLWRASNCPFLNQPSESKKSVVHNTIKKEQGDHTCWEISGIQISIQKSVEVAPIYKEVWRRLEFVREFARTIFWCFGVFGAMICLVQEWDLWHTMAVFPSERALFWTQHYGKVPSVWLTQSDDSSWWVVRICQQPFVAKDHRT